MAHLMGTPPTMGMKDQGPKCWLPGRNWPTLYFSGRLSTREHTALVYGSSLANLVLERIHSGLSL